MQVLIATTPAEGHVNPMVPVARELVDRGHEVRWYAGQAFQEKIDKTGARYEPMRAAYDFSGMSREKAFPHHAGLTGIAGMTTGFKDVFLGPAIDQMTDVLELLDEFPADVMVTDETVFGAGLASERTGIPLAWIVTSVCTFSSRDTAPFGSGLRPSSSPLGRARNTLLRFPMNSLVMRDLRRYADVVRARAGLPRIAKGPFENIVNPPDLYLMSTVPSFEYPRSDMLSQTHFLGPLVDPPPERFDPPAWWDELDGARPVVHVTQGTIANDADRLLVPAIRALAGEDVLVVVTTGIPLQKLRLGPLPRNARLERFVPYYHLLPRVDVVVTNGGYGGVNMALAYGVPLVVAPSTEEKHEVAARVAWTGAGIHLKRRALSEAGIRKAVTTVLHAPCYRERAQALRDECRRYDAPRLAANLIEQLTKTGRRRLTPH
ncbi:MAG: glycosyltransferase [Egibacteraceae bacterium]